MVQMTCPECNLPAPPVTLYGKQSLQIIAASGGSFENVPLHRTLCRHIFDTGTQHQGVLQKGVS